MTNASRDENYVPTKVAALNSDGTTIVPLKVNPSTHGLLVSDGTSGSDHGPATSPRDQNSVPCIMGVSSSDGSTPIVCYANSSGQLLVQST